jgi:two-component system sensor histidine kinase DesK
MTLLARSAFMTGANKAESCLSLEAAARYLWLLWVIWLTFFIYPLSALFDAHPGPLRVTVTLAASVVFALVYSWNIRRGVLRLTAGQPPRPVWWALAVLMAIAFGLTLGDRTEWIELFIYVGVSMAPAFTFVPAVRALAVVVVAALAVGLGVGASGVQATQIALQTGVSGFATIIVVRVVTTERELRLARQEIVRLAVSEERLRFARDLHDLLGHSLSMITLKSELAGRLVANQPERAAAEIRDIEGAARTALQEVREAVAGYRQPGLAGELGHAQEILAAAGIGYTIDGEAGTVPVAVETALAWAVREGITNVIRHSRARHCTVRITRGRQTAAVEIRDDGGSGPAAGGIGSGLAGLSERVAALGGRLEAGPQAGGFRLAATVPLDAPAPGESSEMAAVPDGPAEVAGHRR